MTFDKPGDTHSSYGMIGVAHTTGGVRLVGSEFNHQNFIALTIHRAERKRDLSHEWWFARENVVEVWLSEAQFVELIARPNYGDGVPCTIRRIGKEGMEPPPEPESMREKFRDDFRQHASECVSDLDTAIAELTAAIDEGRIGKTVLRDIAKKLEYARSAVKAGMPFVADQFEEQMERVTNHAAAEIEATVTSMAIRLGIERMRELSASAPKLIEASEPETGGSV